MSPIDLPAAQISHFVAVYTSSTVADQLVIDHDIHASCVAHAAADGMGFDVLKASTQYRIDTLTAAFVMSAENEASFTLDQKKLFDEVKLEIQFLGIMLSALNHADADELANGLAELALN